MAVVTAQLTEAQEGRLEAGELADWKVVGWRPGVPYETIDGTTAWADSGPILRRPDGKLYRITTLGRLVPLHNRRGT